MALLLVMITVGLNDMLRIFGYYSFGKNPGEIASRMAEMFKTKGEFVKYRKFSQENVRLIYEMSDTPDSAQFWFIDKKRQIACFIVGGIHSYERSGQEILTGSNVARWVVEQYIDGGMNFVQHLRGNFNIIILDKKKLFLINDKLGLSPMYIYQMDGGVLFCSEPEPIIWLGIHNKINDIAIAEFLVYGFVPDGDTFIKNLKNQDSGTILKIDNNRVYKNKYYVFKEMNTEMMSDSNIVKLANDIFKESVKIRINKKKGHVFSDLSGGWDTRFVLANLQNLNAKVIVYTKRSNQEDLVIAKKIAKKLNLTQIIPKKSMKNTSNARLFLDLTYQNKYLNKHFKQKDLILKDVNRLIALEFFHLPKFTGLFGGELFGNTPPWFDKSINLNVIVSGGRIFERAFLKKLVKNQNHSRLLNRFGALSNPAYLFLTQIGRSYLNTHYTGGWERPTNFFTYLYELPFTDSKFVSLISGLNYNKYMKYKLYETIYRVYYPNYLDEPWTIALGRKRNDLKELAGGLRGVELIENRINNKKRFNLFLNQNTILNKKNSDVINSKELCFLFNWMNIYKSVLDSSDIERLAGKSFLK